MSEIDSKKKSGRGCLKAILIICGVITLLSVIAIMIVYLNWDSISEMTIFEPLKEAGSRFTDELPYMESLYEELSEKYPSQNIFVKIQTKSTSDPGVSALGLSVEFTNPKFIKANDQTSGQELAKSIAVVVAENYPTINDYDLVIIKFTNEKGIGFTITQGQEYHFPISELLDHDN